MKVTVAAVIVLLVTSPLGSALEEIPAIGAGEAQRLAGLTQHVGDSPDTPARYAGAAATWLELMREAMPKARRVSILVMLPTPHQPEVAGWSALALETAQAARRRGMRSEIITVRHSGELLDAFVMMRQSGIDSIVVLPTPFALDWAADVAGEAARHGLPLMGGHRQLADAGALMSYGPAPRQKARPGMTAADGVVERAPADVPVTTPNGFELVINRKTARALGLTIPPPLSRRADRIID